MSRCCRTPTLARKRSLRVADLRNEPFIFFARRMGPLAFDRTMACCERSGFRPNIVQDAPQWPTLVRLVAAGLGVSLAPACVANVTIEGAVYRDTQAPCRTSVDLGVKVGFRQSVAEKLRGDCAGASGTGDTGFRREDRQAGLPPGMAAPHGLALLVRHQAGLQVVCDLFFGCEPDAGFGFHVR